MSSVSCARNDFPFRSVWVLMKLIFGLLLFVILLAALFVGCSDEPGAVGLGVLPAQDSLQIVSFQRSATSDTTYLSRVVGGGSTLLVGKFQTLQAATLLSFSGLSALPSNAVIDTATLSLKI